MMTSDKYIERIRQGDMHSLAMMFDLYRPRLRRTVEYRLSRKVQGRLDADDVMQEAYLSASQRCASFAGTSAAALLGWLRLIALQTLNDLQRKHLGTQKRDAQREMTLHPEGEFGVGDAAIAHSALSFRALTVQPADARCEIREALLRAIDRLSAIDQHVIALRGFQELSNHEVAMVLGVSQKAASIRYVRALARLKCEMN